MKNFAYFLSIILTLTVYRNATAFDRPLYCSCETWSNTRSLGTCTETTSNSLSPEACRGLCNGYHQHSTTNCLQQTSGAMVVLGSCKFVSSINGQERYVRYYVNTYEVENSPSFLTDAQHDCARQLGAWLP